MDTEAYLSGVLALLGCCTGCEVSGQGLLRELVCTWGGKVVLTRSCLARFTGGTTEGSILGRPASRFLLNLLFLFNLSCDPQ